VHNTLDLVGYSDSNGWVYCAVYVCLLELLDHLQLDNWLAEMQTTPIFVMGRQFDGILPFLCCDNAAHQVLANSDAYNIAHVSPDACPCAWCRATHQNIRDHDVFARWDMDVACRHGAMLTSIGPPRRGLCSIHGTDKIVNAFSEFMEWFIRKVYSRNSGKLGEWAALFGGSKDAKGKWAAELTLRFARERRWVPFMDQICEDFTENEVFDVEVPIAPGPPIVFDQQPVLQMLRWMWTAVSDNADLGHVDWLSNQQLRDFCDNCEAIKKALYVIKKEVPNFVIKPWHHAYCWHFPQLARRWRTVKHFNTYLVDSAHKLVRRAMENTWKGVPLGSNQPRSTTPLQQALIKLIGDWRLQAMGFRVNGLYKHGKKPQLLE